MKVALHLTIASCFVLAGAAAGEPWPEDSILSPLIVENVFIALEGAAKDELDIEWQGTVGPDRGQGQVFGVLGVKADGSFELWSPIFTNCSLTLDRVSWKDKKLGKGWRKQDPPYRFQFEPGSDGGILKFRFARQFPGDSRRPFEFHCEIQSTEQDADTQFFALFESRNERNQNALSDFGRCGKIQVLPK